MITRGKTQIERQESELRALNEVAKILISALPCALCSPYHTLLIDFSSQFHLIEATPYRLHRVLHDITDNLINYSLEDSTPIRISR